MNTSEGTICYDGFLVYESDYRCDPNYVAPSAPAPSSSPSPSPSPSPQTEITPCVCESPGVHCVNRCDPYICLCSSNLFGFLLPTATSTVCVDGYQVWEGSPACSVADSICPNDGFFCMGQCSLTYYECSNGIPSATRLVPYGTVCGITPNATGELIYPIECNTTNLNCSGNGLQCVSNCGTSVQMCMDGVGYALQTVPAGLLCYNNLLHLSSEPVCVSHTQSEPSVSFDITILAENTTWSIVSDSAVAASIVDSFVAAGSNVPITQEMVSVSSDGRRLNQNNNQMNRKISIYAPPEWDSSVVAEILNTHAGNSLLSDSLIFRNYYMMPMTTSSTAPITTPSPSPIANLHIDSPNITASASGIESIVLGATLGCGMFILGVWFLCRRCYKENEKVDEKADEKTNEKQS